MRTNDVPIAGSESLQLKLDGIICLRAFLVLFSSWRAADTDTADDGATTGDGAPLVETRPSTSWVPKYPPGNGLQAARLAS